MHLPNPERFEIASPDQLGAGLGRLGVDVPVTDDLAPLFEPLSIRGRVAPNRLAVQPLECGDGDAEGAPGELTVRRYLHFAEGGFGLIWFEATAVEAAGRSGPRQLWLHARTLKPFAALVRTVKADARHRWGREPLMILQLAHAGRHARPLGVPEPVLACHDPALDRQDGIPDDQPLMTDAALALLQAEYLAAARLAVEAGFDGVDVKACHGDLVSDLLGAITRPGPYGGAFGNRLRFLREILEQVRDAIPRAILASRFAVQAGGVERGSESLALARGLQAAGVDLLNVTVEAPARGPGEPGEGPLDRFARQAEAVRAIQAALPAVPVMGGGYTGLRHLFPPVAAGVLRSGGAAFIGLGRGALAYPGLAADLLQRGALDPDRCCLECSACERLLQDGGAAGCVVMDAAAYGEEYRHRRRFALDHLRDEGRRCRQCQPAPCRTACPARIDVPAFIKAFVEGRETEAYRIIRERDVLPEMCSRLCPVGRLCEGHCVEGLLGAAPVPIHDLQYGVCRLARHRGATGVRLPGAGSGRRVAIVGGGPAGAACAAVLLECGHEVVIFEQGDRLGGTPERLIRRSRFQGAREEIEALLQPALREGRLSFRFGRVLGADLDLEELRRGHDGVFLATGVWAERSLGQAEGVVSAVEFLRRARTGEAGRLPARVALLAGGDGAMDCAEGVRELGARELVIVYAGTLAEMHWHMPDSWFRTEGVQFMMLTRPLGYLTDAAGRLRGLKVRCGGGLFLGDGRSTDAVLEAGLVIEAMGLGLDERVKAALTGCRFDARGLVEVAGGGSLACGPEGVYAGGGMINGGATVVQCIEEGMRAARELDRFLVLT
jgi:NADPH-dependent glutamate synthase beta subunit-like oxidoreductase/2,4-dienoyl-CoA reductase-like NADH-dependent reductase (Old Yellow Enzyme family)